MAQQSTVGIIAGDIVTTSYGTGPYTVVCVTPPRYVDKIVGGLVVRTWPVSSLVLVRCDSLDKTRCYINDVRRLPDGRWFTDQNDEIFVQPNPNAACPVQMQLFAVQCGDPYEFQPGVDYAGQVWQCGRCGADFNAEKLGYDTAWHCNFPALRLTVMPPRPEPPARALSGLQVTLGVGEG